MDSNINTKKSLFPLPVILLLLVLALIFIGIVIFIFHYFSNQGLPSISPASNTTSSSTGTPTVIALEQQAYISNSLGFQMNLPKGWAVQDVNNDPTFLDIYDPTAAYASEISIVSSPNTSTGYDLIKTTTQDNLAKLITNSIIKNGGTVLETDRVSSTSIKILYNQSGQNQPVSSILMYFTPNRSYQVATKIEAVDNNQFINALLRASIATFKIIPVISASTPTVSASNNSSQPVGFVPTFNNRYANPGANFTIQYPAQSDWLWTVTNLDSPQSQQYGILFRDNDTQTFNDEVNPHAQIDINETARPYPNPALLLNSQVNLILSGYKNPTSITQHITGLTPSLPTGFIANTFEVRGGSVVSQGATLTKEDGLFMVAVDPSGNLYQFDYRSDAEDFNNFYPLAVAILKTFTIQK